eukprot:TRINITY_DN5458_c0_g1_i1.p1 TRINITY_DN5458_c0_g1~~TRINITY_DN5458_c0_g1_i1.p1  ORF type:complete len:566 (+),score=118.33 TRINITY_DN5458_c0_g1_i1:134-1699(+)
MSAALPIDVFHHIIVHLDLEGKRSLRTTCSTMRSFSDRYLQKVVPVRNIAALLYDYYFPVEPRWIEVIPKEGNTNEEGEEDYTGRRTAHQKLGTYSDRKTKHFFMLIDAHPQELPGDRAPELEDGFSVHGLRRIVGEEDWFIDDLPIIAKSTELIRVYDSCPRFFDPPIFHRLGWDRKVSYGDGGSTILQYPVFVAPHLGISDQTKNNLTKYLTELGAMRNDFQSNQVVQDIIDPDLFPFRTESTFRQRMEQLSKTDFDTFKNLHRGTFDNPSTYVALREKYQWIPCEISIDTQDYFVKFESPIHNLPFSENKNLYVCIGKVFRAMGPMMQRLDLLDGDRTTLQVVIKAQTYRIEPGMSYAGRWHTDGVTENIIAAGIYYCSVGEHLMGGNLKFRPRHAPQRYYDIETDYEAIVRDGGAIFFGNSIPHRFRKIVNEGTEVEERMFVNFFIVDPKKPMISTRNLPKDYRMESISIAKRLREEARSEMKNRTTGWGWINWGNAGHVEYVYDASVWEHQGSRID